MGINATDVLSAAHASAVELAAPTDQSLNAGAMLPDEPIPDVLTNEVEADSQILVEMLPKLNNDPGTPATESNFNALSYLRSDLTHQRGMSQRIATEAIALLPNFGQGRPVNYYSRHPSPTGYQMAMEEIDAGLRSDVLSQIAAQLNTLHNVVMKDNSWVVKSLYFQRRADQISMQASILGEFKALAVASGFNWDDAAFRQAAVDPSRPCPPILSLPNIGPGSFATMDEYYMVHFEAPAILEMMTTYMGQWNRAFEAALADADAKVDEPDMQDIYSGALKKKVKIDQVADMFLSAEDKCQPATNADTLTLLAAVANASQQARVEDIEARRTSYHATVSDLAETLGKVSNALLGNSDQAMVANLSKLVVSFSKVNSELGRSYNEIQRWCVHAGIATSYVGVLTSRVVKHAWEAINLCRDTMQMRESAYLQLKTMYDDLQAPVTSNAV